MTRSSKKRSPARLALIVAAYPKRAAATRAARALVRDGVLACATVTSGATAFYRWEGKFCAEASTLLWGKTTRAAARRAIEAIRALHPDRVPEILALEAPAALPEYAAWVAGSVRSKR